MSWWRHNRWALVALPFALVLALAASSELVKPYWYEKGFHSGETGRGDTVRLHNRYDDGHLTYRGDATVKATGWGPFSFKELAGGFPGAEVRVPRSTRVWGVGLKFTAKPRAVLWGCQVGLVGDDGRLYTAGRDVDAPGLPTNVYNCEPDDEPGPSPAIGKPVLEHPVKPRPTTYQKFLFTAVPTGVKPVRIRIWWQQPRYVEIRLSEVRRG